MPREQRGPRRLVPITDGDSQLSGEKGGVKHGAKPHEAGSVPSAHFPNEETVASSAQAPQPVLTGCGSRQATQSVSTQVPMGCGPSSPT